MTPASRETSRTGHGAPAGLLCIGEPLVELRPVGDQIEIGVGGDMLNAAARAGAHGLRAGLVYVKSGDGLGEWLEQAVCRLGVAPITRTGPGTTGLYSITTGLDGERSFSYWRDDTACASLTPDDVTELPDGYSVLLVSGITQALSVSAEAAVETAVEAAARAGLTVAYDPNVRPALWSRRGGLPDARRATERLLERVDVFLPSVEDCRYLWGGSDGVIRRAVASRSAHAVVKAGADGAWLHLEGDWQAVPPSQAATPVDTTGAGDAFNAAYLAALTAGAEPVVGAARAAATAAATVSFAGALGDLSADVAPPPDHNEDQSQEGAR